MKITQQIITNSKRLFNIIFYKNLDPIEFYINEEKKVVYIENAKCACSTIKKILFPEVVDYGMEVHEVLRSRAKLSIGRDAEAYKLFTVVRNPFSRIVSCYKDKVLGLGEDQSKKGMYETCFFKVLFLIFSGKKFKGKETSFAEFVYLVSKVPDFICDRHFRSQKSMVHNKYIEKNIKYIKIEELNSSWNDILEGRLDYPDNLSNKTGGNQWRAFYTNDDTVNLVVNRYKEDFDFYKYSKKIK